MNQTPILGIRDVGLVTLRLTQRGMMMTRLIRQLLKVLKDHGLATVCFLIIIFFALFVPWNLIPLDIYNLLLR
mgnify:CR=1 FL=1|tara:strand:+ start:96 stop:314 length:219 start_codon:yes stop_codon:yes gene_type:complete